MRPICRSSVLLALLGMFTASQAHAETFHTCGTIINTVPTVITTQGVYCLSHDLATAITSGNAISVNANNVVLDCNGYKIGGLAAGTSSNTSGIYADTSRLNITVRNCGIRGFYAGISLNGGAGHLIEDNRLDNNLETGIFVNGDNNLVQRNRVYDTGGRPNKSASYGIFANADVIDNTVAGLFATLIDTYPQAITLFGDGTEARGNRVRGLVVGGGGYAVGINVNSSGVTVRNNSVALKTATNGEGIFGASATDTFCTGNTVAKFNSPFVACQDAGGNASN